MAVQLVLIDDSDHPWRIDEHTREVGRRGIAAARQVLRSARRPDDPMAADTGTEPARRTSEAA